MRNLIYLIIGISFLFTGCNPTFKLSDQSGTEPTKELYKRMKALSKKGVMVGYEDALAYGIGWWAENEMCDMYRVSGEYPAIYGWDLGDIHNPENLDGVSFDNMLLWIREVHRMGGINTISWHMDNPVSGASSWDKSKIGAQILPGGEFHDKFLERLDMAAEFLKKCKTNDSYVPIIFRPYHEHNGDWFWWGKGNLDEDQYKAIYRFTADYFKNHHDIHHLIYAFSPDRSRLFNPSGRDEYLWGYPGDEYVDLIGIDNYHDMRTTGNDSLDQIAVNNLVASLELVTDIAEEKGKISALTETGMDGIKDPEWFSNKILKPLKSSPKAQRISYVLMWRNRDKDHHFMPFPNHSSSKDFQYFIKEPMILSLSDIGMPDFANKNYPLKKNN